MPFKVTLSLPLRDSSHAAGCARSNHEPKPRSGPLRLRVLERVPQTGGVQTLRGVDGIPVYRISSR